MIRNDVRDIAVVRGGIAVRWGTTKVRTTWKPSTAEKRTLDLVLVQSVQTEYGSIIS